MPNTTTDRTSYYFEGREVFPLGPVEGGMCFAGWTDRQGRQYDRHICLVCEDCGCTSDDDRGKVTTDSARRTLCRECRAGVEPTDFEPDVVSEHAG